MIHAYICIVILCLHTCTCLELHIFAFICGIRKVDGKYAKILSDFQLFYILKIYNFLHLSVKLSLVIMKCLHTVPAVLRVVPETKVEPVEEEGTSS